jgi:hypothetical protein
MEWSVAPPQDMKNLLEIMREGGTWIIETE